MKNIIKNDLDKILYYQNHKYEGIGKLIIKEIHPESKINDIKVKTL